MQSVGLNGAPDSQGGEGGGERGDACGGICVPGKSQKAISHHVRDNMDTGNTALLR